MDRPVESVGQGFAFRKHRVDELVNLDISQTTDDISEVVHEGVFVGHVRLPFLAYFFNQHKAQ